MIKLAQVPMQAAGFAENGDVESSMTDDPQATLIRQLCPEELVAVTGGPLVQNEGK